jgi:hypothetical protein
MMWAIYEHVPFIGHGRSFGWQPVWSEPIILQPGESVEFLIPYR